jgi:hypothetical protein
VARAENSSWANAAPGGGPNGALVGDLADRQPGGAPMHGLLDDEVAEIVALYHEWG